MVLGRTMTMARAMALATLLVTVKVTAKPSEKRTVMGLQMLIEMGTATVSG